MAGSIKIGPPAIQPSQVFFISNFCLRNPSQVLKYRVNQKLPAFPLPGAPFFLPTPVMNETQVIMKIFIIVGKFIHTFQVQLQHHMDMIVKSSALPSSAQLITVQDGASHCLIPAVSSSLHSSSPFLCSVDYSVSYLCGCALMF